MTGEEVMDVLLKQLPFSEKLKGAEFLFDGFTGFTPIQVNVLRELLVIADRISVTVTMDEREDAFSPGKTLSAFLYEQTDDTDTCRADQRSGGSGVSETIRTVPVCTGTCLTVSGEKYLPLQKGRVCRRTAGDKNYLLRHPPMEEMREAARRMSELVRTCGYRYGEIAVITGNLEEYARLAAQVFEEADIPYFIDEKHSVMMNPLWSICALPWRWRYRDFLMRVFSVISDAGCQKLPENRLISWRITCWRWESGEYRNV